MIICVEGNDGTGKSTLVKSLRRLGLEVEDRGEMTRATDDDTVLPHPQKIYVLLVCSPEESKRRLLDDERDMSDPYHSDEALQKYDRRFRELADKFRAHVIDSVNAEQTLHDVLDVLLVKNIKIGMPTGRLKGVEALGHPFDVQKDGRNMVSKTGHFTYVWTRTKTYPQMVTLGDLDLALVGSDAIHGNPWASNCRIIWSGAQPNVRVCLIGVDGIIPKKKLLRVATPFPEWASNVLSSRGIPHTIYSVSGGSESFISQGLADIAFDIVETGETLLANNLQIIEEIGPVEVYLIGKCT